MGTPWNWRNIPKSKACGSSCSLMHSEPHPASPASLQFHCRTNKLTSKLAIPSVNQHLASLDLALRQASDLASACPQTSSGHGSCQRLHGEPVPREPRSQTPQRTQLQVCRVCQARRLYLVAEAASTLSVTAQVAWPCLITETSPSLRLTMNEPSSVVEAPNPQHHSFNLDALMIVNDHAFLEETEKKAKLGWISPQSIPLAREEKINIWKH